MSNIADKIRTTRDYSSEIYTIPEWEVEIEIRSLTARARTHFVEELQIQTKNGGPMGELVKAIIVGSCFDPATGELVFTHEDGEWLMAEKSGAVVDRLATKCLQVSGLADKAVDTAGKDSSDSQTNEESSTTNDDSGSTSPES